MVILLKHYAECFGDDEFDQVYDDHDDDNDVGDDDGDNGNDNEDDNDDGGSWYSTAKLLFWKMKKSIDNEDDKNYEDNKVDAD